MALSDYWNVNPDTSFTLTPDTSVKTQGYYDAVKANNPKYYETIKDQDPAYIASQKAAATDTALSSAVASASAPVSVPTVASSFVDPFGPNFASDLLPDSLASTYASKAYKTSRQSADDFIANMLKRGTLTESGRGAAVQALDAQAPKVRSKLNDLSNALLASDRSQITDIANEGRQAGEASGGSFDPSGYLGRAQSIASSLSSGFGDKLNSTLPPGDLFDTSGLAGSGGAVTGPQNVSFDPYAQSGGQLSTGLGDNSSSRSISKRRTSIF